MCDREPSTAGTRRAQVRCGTRAAQLRRGAGEGLRARGKREKAQGHEEHVCAVVEDHNQRLEFLGDAVRLIYALNPVLRALLLSAAILQVLEFITTHHLFVLFPYQFEGKLTDHRSGLINNKATPPLLAVPLSSSLFTRSPSPRDLYAGAALLRVAARAAVPPAHERPHIAGAPLTRHVACDAPPLSERLPDFDRASRGSTGTRTRIRCSPTASRLCSVPCTSTRSAHPRHCSGPSFHLSVCSGQGVEPCRGLLARCAFWSQRELPLRRLWLVAGSQPYEPPESIERNPQVSLRHDSCLIEVQSWFADGVI